MSRNPSTVEFVPEFRVWRDGNSWMAFLGEYPSADSVGGYGETIQEAIRKLVEELDRLDNEALERVLGGAKLT